MIGGSVPKLRSQRGFSLVELLVAMGIAAFVLIGIGGVVYLLFMAPSTGNARLDAEHDLQNAATWIARDGNMASAFTALTGTDYGKFTWTDWSGASPVYYTSTYRFAGTTLLRDFSASTGSSSTSTIARHIGAFGDVSFVPGGRAVTVAITSTAQSAQGPVILTTTITTMLRPGPTPTPVNTPAPPP